MNKTIGLTAFFALVTSQFVVAAEVVSLKLSGEFAYRDVTVACSNLSLGNDIYFMAEVENDLPIRAHLSRYQHTSSPTFIYNLNEQELKQIVLYKDYYGKYWLGEMVLASQTIAWALYRLGDFSCKIPMQLKTVEPSMARFFFETDSLGLEYMLSPSNEVELNGIREDGKPWEADLDFIQRQAD